VIAGIYGMNFTHMPELAWTYGYPSVLAVMAAVGLLLGFLFRRRGWL
jgi:magnesium transporter